MAKEEEFKEECERRWKEHCRWAEDQMFTLGIISKCHEDEVPEIKEKSLFEMLSDANSEADRWLKEATEQRDRADKAEAERDELKESLAQATHMMKYAGKMQ